MKFIQKLFHDVIDVILLSYASQDNNMDDNADAINDESNKYKARERSLGEKIGGNDQLYFTKVSLAMQLNHEIRRLNFDELVNSQNQEEIADVKKIVVYMDEIDEISRVKKRNAIDASIGKLAQNNNFSDLISQCEHVCGAVRKFLSDYENSAELLVAEWEEDNSSRPYLYDVLYLFARYEIDRALHRHNCNRIVNGIELMNDKYKNKHQLLQDTWNNKFKDYRKDNHALILLNDACIAILKDVADKEKNIEKNTALVMKVGKCTLDAASYVYNKVTTLSTSIFSLAPQNNLTEDKTATSEDYNDHLGKRLQKFLDTHRLSSELPQNKILNACISNVANI